MIKGIIIAALIVGAIGIFIGLFLGVAGLKFKVEVDPKEEEVLGALPGNNCGGCGYAGCSGLAAAIAKGEAPVNACPVGGEPVGKKIAEIMGVEAESATPMVAYVHCQGDCNRAASYGVCYGRTGNHALEGTCHNSNFCRSAGETAHNCVCSLDEEVGNTASFKESAENDKYNDEF